MRRKRYSTNNLKLLLVGVIVLGSIVLLPQARELVRLLDLDPVLMAGTMLVLIGAVGVAGLISYFEYHGFGCQDGIVRRGPREPIVCLTFDDGPSPKYTPQILDILKEKGSRATFFVVGAHVKKYPEIARRIVEEGHDIGNHTYGHRELIPASRASIKRQVRKAAQAIRAVTGVTPRLFRPPRGIYSNAVRKLLVEEEGYRIILWTVSSIDWRRLSPRLIVRRVAHYTKPGGILLFHDSGALIRREGAKRTNTVQALPMVIDYLQEAGYEIVPVSEMLRRLAREEADRREAFERA